MILNKLGLVLCTFYLLGCQTVTHDVNSGDDAVEPNLLKSVASNKLSIVAPGSWLDANGITVFQKKYPNSWKKISYQSNEKYPYLSNTDEQRFKYFLDALSNKMTSVIWALRGGYGSQRIISFFLNTPKPIQHKWIVGYSDITAIHLFVSQKWGWKSIHGSVVKEVTNDKKDPKNFQYLDDILSNTPRKITYSGLKLVHGGISKPIVGKLTGGNAKLISTSIGTPWEIEAKGKIVIIEEYGDGYRVDRVLQHLKHSKILEGAVAIIIGEIITQDMENTMIINDFIKDINIPVFKTDMFGHGSKNYPWIYNAYGEITHDNSGDYQLSFSTQ